MDELLAVAVFVFGIFVWPILAGCLFFLFTAFPIVLIMEPILIGLTILGKGLCKCHAIPFLGRMFTFIVSLSIAVFLIGILLVGIGLPLVFLSALFVSGEASEPNVDCKMKLIEFYCTHFKWLANMCNCLYTLYYTEGAETCSPLLGIFKAFMLSIPMMAANCVPLLYSIRIVAWAAIVWSDDYQ